MTQTEELLRNTILNQCKWSDTYSSVKHVLKRTQLPIIISFDQKGDQLLNKTVLFFKKEHSKKIFLSPLKKTEKENRIQFEYEPKQCVFAITDIYKGVFELVRNGQRCSRVFTNLENLLSCATSTPTFMSRDSVIVYYGQKWKTKEYIAGSIFNAERIHRSTLSTVNDKTKPIRKDFIECLDETGETVYIQLTLKGRFSIIATDSTSVSADYLYSTQVLNLDRLFNENNTNYLRLVRGTVPNNFRCQYMQYLKQQENDVLVGVMRNGLLIELNLDQHIPCRYARNLYSIVE
ncbi:unnamed protein product, partial [Didymodactylos carnosus]